MAQARSWRLAIAALLLATGCGAAGPSEPASGLWPLVQRCIAHQQASGDPAPCLSVDPAQGYAILKDLRGETQFLLVATDRRWGIEDPRIEAKDAPNYFAAAWSARGCVARAEGAAVPEDDLSLAINSRLGRSDGQLHIHIDRLRPEVARELGRGGAELVFAGHAYRLRHVESLAGTNLFADLTQATGTAIGDYTIVVAGDPQGGFFVLTDHARGSDAAGGEELQVAHPPLTHEQFTAIEQLGAGCADPPK